MANPIQENRDWGMKGTALFLVAGAALVAGLYFAGPRRASHLVGKKAPPVEYKFPGSENISLEHHLGKVVLANFWASWCAPCIEEMSSLHDMEKSLEGKPFVLLAFNIDEDHPPAVSPNKLDSFPENLIYTFDKQLLGPYQISSIPFSVLIDKTGVIREAFWGPRRWNDPEALREVSAYF